MDIRYSDVVAVCPIRNRGWVVEDHVLAISRQPTWLSWLFYLTGDNEDDTQERLDRALSAERFPDPNDNWTWDWVRYEVFDTGCPAWHRSREPRYSLDDHANLARVYNRMIDRALGRWPEATHLWLVDSDVLPEPDCLERLLEADRAVVSAVVQHAPRVWNFMGTRDLLGEPRRDPRDGELLAAGKLFEVKLVSCCTLIRREALERGARFAPHPRSHDFPFCAALRELGYSLWVQPAARAEHRMKEPENLHPEASCDTNSGKEETLSA